MALTLGIVWFVVADIASVKSAHVIKSPIPGVDVTIEPYNSSTSRGKSGKILESTQTNNHGDFEITSLKTGARYYLHLKCGKSCLWTDPSAKSVEISFRGDTVLEKYPMRYSKQQLIDG